MSCTFLTCGSTMFFLSECSLNLLNIIVKHFLHMWVNYAPGVSCVYACLCVCACTHLPMHASRAQFLCCFFPDQCLSNYNGYRAVTRSVLHLMQTLGQCSGRHSMLKHNYVQTLQSDVAHCTGRYWTSLGEISLAVVGC